MLEISPDSYSHSTLPQSSSEQEAASKSLEGRFISTQSLPEPLTAKTEKATAITAIAENFTGSEPKVPLATSSGRELKFSVAETVADNPYSLGLYILRQNGMARMHRFLNDYQDGWGDGSGKALAREAYTGLFTFLRYAPINVGSRPSIFMTIDGGLELAWDDTAGNDIRVEFNATEVQYYFARSGREGRAPIEEVRKIAEAFLSLE